MDGRATIAAVLTASPHQLLDCGIEAETVHAILTFVNKDTLVQQNNH